METADRLMDTNTQPGAPRRVLSIGVFLALVGAALGAVFGGAGAGVGAAGGVFVSALYAVGYLRSHLRARERVIDRSLAQSTLIRLGAVALGGAATALAGRTIFIWYLTSFAVAFGVLVAVEIPRAARELRNRGLIGGGKAT